LREVEREIAREGEKGVRRGELEDQEGGRDSRS
jgi:hypothetical protein